MFEALFGGKRRPTTEDFATRLLAIAWDGDMHSRFYAELNMTEMEKLRYAFTTFLFTVTLPVAWVRLPQKEHLTPFVSETFGLTLQSWGNRDRRVGHLRRSL